MVFTIYTMLREAEIHKMPRNEYELQGFPLKVHAAS